MTSGKKVCKYPYEYIEINQKGNICSCYAQYHHHKYFGNIYERPFEDIWNGYKAMRFRERLYKGDYSLCNFDNCAGSEKDYHVKNANDLLAPYPKTIAIGIDNTCSKRCIICRDKIKKIPSDKEKQLISMIMPTFIPMLKNAEIVSLKQRRGNF